ncbi:helix-turn-helix domain-containing protein [Streptomyces filipinensis]|uniref:helix-turn-helix domain-containing protein n=1 Tax=Streptomyces filipinensis TaxID=66887 RepID=UPI001785A453|nr:helix-turn-helix transcriptional regulator [Streptomyces filipinensis]
MTNQVSNEARVIPLRPVPARPAGPESSPARNTGNTQNRETRENAGQREGKEPLWRDLVGEVLRRERRSQERTLKDVADAARISLPYLSEIERGRKEASSEVLAAAAHALGLGLADLLSLTHAELTRHTTPHRRPAAARPRPSTGLCLAA